MSVDYTAKIIKGYKLPYEVIKKCLDADSIESLCCEGILHRLDNYSCDSNFIFGYPTGDCVEDGDAVPITFDNIDPCQENKENNDLMLRAMSLFSGYLPHNYPKYYLALKAW